MELGLQDAGIVGLLITVVLLLLRELLGRGQKNNHVELTMMVDRLLRMHEDSDSKFATVHLMERMIKIEMKLESMHKTNEEAHRMLMGQGKQQ